VSSEVEYRYTTPDGRVVVVQPMGDDLPDAWFVWREDDPSGMHGGGGIFFMAASVLGYNIAVDEPPFEWVEPWAEEVERDVYRRHGLQPPHYGPDETRT
jgi:hypothetical protein